KVSDTSSAGAPATETSPGCQTPKVSDTSSAGAPSTDLLAGQEHEHVFEVRRPRLAVEAVGGAEHCDARAGTARAQSALARLAFYLGEPRRRAVHLEHLAARMLGNEVGGRPGCHRLAVRH